MFQTRQQPNNKIDFGTKSCKFWKSDENERDDCGEGAEVEEKENEFFNGTNVLGE